jgi:anti-sigma factor RsiW
MNDHPEELLADYVEGTLDADDRARVDAHLETCEQCREEVGLATEARAALAALPDLEAPRGIPLAVRRKGRTAPSRTLRRVGAVAVAAALVAGGAIVISNVDLGGDSSADSTAGGDGAGSEQPARVGDAPAPEAGEAADQGKAGGGTATIALTGPPVIPVYVESQHDYVPDRLSSLARRLRDDAHAAVDAGIRPSADAFFKDFDESAFTPEVRQAIRCVLTEVPPTQLIVPFRIEAATFEGTPAYIAAFLQGPSPEEPYDRIVIWVVDREGCSLLSLASQVL